MRWLLLVIALVACKSKSEPAEQSRPVTPTGGEVPGGAHAGSGSAVDNHQGGSGAPNIATPVTATPVTPTDTGVIQPVKGGTREKDEPRPDPAPATPTPAKPDDTVKPAEASSEKPAPSGLSGVGGGGPRPPPLGDQRLPPGTIGFTSITALDASTLTAADAGSKIKTAYQAGLKRCYLVHLSTHAAAKGTAKLTFTVGVEGLITAPAATSFAPDLEACLTTVAARWRFPVPTDPKTMNPAPTRFAVELLFNPG